MAKLVIDVKDNVKLAIEKFADKNGMSIKHTVLSCIGALMTSGADPDFLIKKELKKK